MSNAETHRDLHDFFNTRDLDSIVKRCTDDFRYRDRARGVEIVGREAFKAWLTEWTLGMSNARATDAHYLDAGLTTVALFAARGIHDGPLGPLPASGNELVFPICEVLTYDADGDVTGGEIYYDQMTIAGQAAGAPQVITREPGEGDAYWMLGGLYEVLVSSDESGGAVTTMQMTLPAGMGPPPHTHPGTETVYVVDGTIRYHIGDDTIEAGPGAFFSLPAGTVENFEPVTDAKLLVSYLPGGVERFFAEAGEPAARREVPPAPTAPPDVERLAAIGARHGLHIQAPPS